MAQYREHGCLCCFDDSGDDDDSGSGSGPVSCEYRTLPGRLTVTMESLAEGIGTVTGLYEFCEILDGVSFFVDYYEADPASGTSGWFGGYNIDPDTHDPALGTAWIFMNLCVPSCDSFSEGDASCPDRDDVLLFQLGYIQCPHPSLGQFQGSYLGDHCTATITDCQLEPTVRIVVKTDGGLRWTIEG